MIRLKFFLLLIGFKAALGAVLPPPWANPKLNPCANQPGGWQLLYWPPDGKCYKIFKTGYPCSDDMELTPTTNRSSFSAECRCPPETAQSARDGKCYRLYTNGPCEKNYYFAPDTKYNANNSSKRKWGFCTQMQKCPKPNEIFHPRDATCYPKHTKGPCHKGQLLTLSPQQIAECQCSAHSPILREFYHQPDQNCYQHYTRGPCKEPGHLFLPDRTCACHSFLPHFHAPTAQCHELGTIGPCHRGEHFQLDAETRRGLCACKTGYIRHAGGAACYRPFTQGPCDAGGLLINATTCIAQPCRRGYLYFHSGQKCHRIGSRGPCRKGQIVTFDFRTRPSLDGVSYNGVCSCQKDVFSDLCLEQETIECELRNGFVLYNKRCYKLYEQGTCGKGAWLVPKRHKKQNIWSDDVGRNEGFCECIPGYTKSVKIVDRKEEMACIAPTVILAEFLNRNYTSIARIISF